MASLERTAGVVAAKRIFPDAAKNWKNLSREERNGFIKKASAATTREDRARAARLNAVRLSAKDGKDWRTMTREEKRVFIATARRGGDNG